MPVHPAPRLLLGDLLAADSFGLELVSGGPDAAMRPVLGAHVVEVDEPARWLAPNWVMLTTGLRLHGNADAQRALPAALREVGATALGFGVGFRYKRVPPLLVRAARAVGLPLFVVPYETAFRQLVQYIDGALSAPEAGMFRRLTSLQRHLLDALRGAEPVSALVGRLAEFLDVGVLLLDPTGSVEAEAGTPPPVAEVRRALPARANGLAQLQFAGWSAVAVQVVPGGPASRWLVLARRAPHPLDALSKSAAETAAPLLAASDLLGAVAREQEQALRGALLEEAVRPTAAGGPVGAGGLAARAAAFGLDFSAPVRAIVITGVAESAPARTESWYELVGRLEQARIPHLVSQRADSLVALVQGQDATLAPVLDAVLDFSGSAVAGAGRQIVRIEEVGHSLRDAELALGRAGRGTAGRGTAGRGTAGRGTARRIVRFEELDLGTLAVSELPPERLAPKVEEIMAPLRGNPLLHEAVVSYFDHDLDVIAAAAALHLHPNSLRYRLTRVERLLGRSLREPATITALYLAFAAEGCWRSR